MSYVASVSAVLRMMWPASAAMSAVTNTRSIRRQVLEDLAAEGRVVGGEVGGVLGADFCRSLLEPVGIATGEGDLVALGAGASSCF